MSGSLRAARGWKLAIERDGYCVRVSADDVQTLAGTAEPATGLGNDPSCRPLPDGGPLRLTLYGVATTPGAGTSIVVLANGMVIAGVAVAPETWLRTLVTGQVRAGRDRLHGMIMWCRPGMGVRRMTSLPLWWGGWRPRRRRRMR
jgi:hypothetical protein